MVKCLWNNRCDEISWYLTAHTHLVASLVTQEKLSIPVDCTIQELSPVLLAPSLTSNLPISFAFSSILFSFLFFPPPPPTLSQTLNHWLIVEKVGVGVAKRRFKGNSRTKLRAQPEQQQQVRWNWTNGKARQASNVNPPSRPFVSDALDIRI